MSWDDKDNKTKKNKDQDYISRENEYEIPEMIKKYEGKYSLVKKNEIESIIEECLDNIGAPFPRDDVEKCVDRKLRYKNIARRLIKNNQ